MRLEWLNNDFFCVDGKYPFHNINEVRTFTVREIDCDRQVESYIVMTYKNGNTCNLCKFDSLIDANKELYEFLKSRGIVAKDDEKILVD